MSSGANIKALSQSRRDAGVTSSLPLPHSMMPLPNMDPKQQKSSLPNPTVQYQHSERRQSAYSSSSASSGPANLLKGSTLKNHLLQQKTSMYYHRGSAAAGRTDGVCSAYSSPQVPKRETPRSKDTLDLCNTTLTQRALRDLQMRKNSNKNWTFGKYRQRNVENACQGDTLHRLTANPQSGQGRGRLLYSKSLNGNETSVVSTSGLENFHKNARKSQEMGNTLEESIKRKPYSSYQTFNMARRSSEPGKVNMAAVAPFRFR
ncbi:hypothetical protein FQA47_020778 [Oryzias melastigma]|uniref:Uncharacterized protein n=2 Tax=Oryzias melastigma TaxID=30732 RepID=A0A834CS40_ORYME|nr:hypothetical protein FQA47_020778 [Oryzias melastigma]